MLKAVDSMHVKLCYNYHLFVLVQSYVLLFVYWWRINLLFIISSDHTFRWFYSLLKPHPRCSYALQMKGRWESGSHLCIPRNETVQPPYFQNRTITFCLPIPTLIYLWEIYIFPGSVCLFCCSQICEPIQGIYKSLTDTWMWKLGLRPRNSQKRIT